MLNKIVDRYIVAYEHIYKLLFASTFGPFFKTVWAQKYCLTSQPFAQCPIRFHYLCLMNDIFFITFRYLI